MSATTTDDGSIHLSQRESRKLAHLRAWRSTKPVGTLISERRREIMIKSKISDNKGLRLVALQVPTVLVLCLFSMECIGWSVYKHQYVKGHVVQRLVCMADCHVFDSIFIQ